MTFSLRVPSCYSAEEAALVRRTVARCSAADWRATARDLALAVRDEAKEPALLYVEDVSRRLDRVGEPFDF